METVQAKSVNSTIRKIQWTLRAIFFLSQQCIFFFFFFLKLLSFSKILYHKLNCISREYQAQNKQSNCAFDEQTTSKSTSMFILNTGFPPKHRWTKFSFQQDISLPELSHKHLRGVGGSFIINLILESSFFLCCKYVPGCHWEQSGYGSLLNKQ